MKPLLRGLTGKSPGAVLAALVFVGCLAACGGGDERTAEPAGSTPSAATANVATETEKQKVASAVSVPVTTYTYEGHQFDQNCKIYFGYSGPNCLSSGNIEISVTLLEPLSSDGFSGKLAFTMQSEGSIVHGDQGTGRLQIAGGKVVSWYFYGYTFQPKRNVTISSSYSVANGGADVIQIATNVTPLAGLGATRHAGEWVSLRAPVTINPESLADAEHYLSYPPVQFIASGGDGGPYTWSASGLPLGFSFSPGGLLASALVTASPGTYSFHVTAADKAGSPVGIINPSIAILGMDCTKHVTMQNAMPTRGTTGFFAGQSAAITSSARSNSVYLESGASANKDKIEVFGVFKELLQDYAISFPELVLTQNPGDLVPPGRIYPVYYQNVEGYSGAATYLGTGAIMKAVILTPAGVPVSSFFDWAKNNGGKQNDSPDVIVPGSLNGHKLNTVSFTKSFIVFAGCHSAEDYQSYGKDSQDHELVPLPSAAAIRPMKTLSWSVRFHGIYTGGNSTVQFYPDTALTIDPAGYIPYTGTPVLVQNNANAQTMVVPAP